MHSSEKDVSTCYWSVRTKLVCYHITKNFTFEDIHNNNMQSFHDQTRTRIYSKCAQMSLQECELRASYFPHRESECTWWELTGTYSHCYCTRPTLQFLIHSQPFLSLISSWRVEKWRTRLDCWKKQLCLETRNIMKTEFKE